MVRLKSYLIYLLVIIPSVSYGNTSFSACKDLFYRNIPPKTVNSKISQSNYSFCYEDFAVNYSGISKTGLWSAEYVTPLKLKLAQSFPREDNFQEEVRVPNQFRAKLSDYKGSGMDRGHLSASAQRSSREAQSNSFLLSNIIPQNSILNQGPWAELEKATRAYIKKTKQSAYIITGPLFIGPKLKTVGSNVLVPTHVFKVIYFPTLDVVGAYVAVNDSSGRMDTVSINQLQQHSGIVFFPTKYKESVLNERFELPMTPNEVSKTNRIQKSSNNNSPIFDMSPNSSIQNYENKKPQYLENRDVAKDLGKGLIDELKDSGIKMLRSVLY